MALGRRKPQHPAAWVDSRAGARLTPAVGKPRCSSIARTPLPAFTYAKTRLLPPHLTQANTSKSNVLFSNSAQSTPGVLSFIRSFLAAASLPALASSAWGTRNGRSLAPGAKTPWNLVRFARGGGTRDATRRNSSSPVGTWRSPAPRTGTGRALPRWLPPAMWPGSPAPPRTAPSPPAAFAGTPTRAFPPAPPQPHLARAHATVRLPRPPVEPLPACGIGAYETKLQQTRAGGGRFDSRRLHWR